MDRIYALYARPNRTNAQIMDSMTYGLWAFAEVRPKSRATQIVRNYMERRGSGPGINTQTCTYSQ